MSVAKFHERKLLNFWIGLPDCDRREILESNAGSYSSFVQHLSEVMGRQNDLELSMKRKGTDEKEVAALMQKQMAIVVESRKPKASRKQQIFLLRHLWSARVFLGQGRTYSEIAKYFRLYRKFCISPKTLKEWIEAASIQQSQEVTA